MTPPTGSDEPDQNDSWPEPRPDPDAAPTDAAPSTDSPGSTPPPGFAGATEPGAQTTPPATAGEPTPWTTTAPPRPLPSTRPRRVLWFLAGLALAIVITVAVVAFGQGSGDDSADGPQPEATIEALNAGFIAADPAALCAQLSLEAASRVFDEQGVTCAEATRQVFLITDDPASLTLEVGTVRVDGDRAAIDAVSSQGALTVDLVFEDGAWKLDEPAVLGIGFDVPNDPEAPTGQPPGPAGAAACAAELRTVQAAVEAYAVTFGMAPTATQDLVDGGVLREAPTMAEVNADGTVSAAGPCA